MKIYTINVSEMLCRSVFVKANSRDEAEKHVLELYDKGEIVLDYEDYVDCSGEVSFSEEQDMKNFNEEWIDYDLTKGKTKL